METSPRTGKLSILGSVLCAAGITAAAVSAVAALSRRKTPSVLAGKTVLITGGSRGLGLAVAERFARAGCRIALVARDITELARAQEFLVERGAVTNPADILLIAADVTERAQAVAAVRDAIAVFGRLDVLINNAGIIEVAPFEDQPFEAFERSIETHLYAPLHTVQAVLPHMLQRHEAGEKHAGYIVNIASIGGKVAVPHLLPYCAGKFALVGFSEGLHSELRHKGIRVTTVTPGLLRTGSFVQAQFAGQSKKEFRWFSLSSIAPLLAASSEHAASRIYEAVVNGRAEITITPQATLAARMQGLAPETTQLLASLAHHYVLPDPSGNNHLTPGRELQPEDGRAVKLQTENNQLPEAV